MIEIPLGRRCYCLVTVDEIRKMLLQKQNEQIYIDGVGRGKGRLRYLQGHDRQAAYKGKSERNLSDNGYDC